MHSVVVLALDGVIAFDATTPVEVFGRVRTSDGEPAYEVAFAGPRSRASSGPTALWVPHRLDAVAAAGTVIVPGRADPTAPLEPSVVRALRDAAANGARIASICVGALDLAATGLLDGLRATTHWRAAGLLAQRHPEIEVDVDALYVDNGQFLCSAGAAAGIDLCLHLIARDHGGAIAADAARTTVVPLTRNGDQAQYIRDDSLGSTGLTATLQWIEEHSAEPISIADIARTAAVSPRTLHRRFSDEVGVPPSAWLNRVRVRHAQLLLETTDWPMERVSTAVGLGSAANLRARFGDVLGTSPSQYRRALAPTGTRS